ncbi:MAG: Spy/CpxP family protein refolding chaperone [Nitrospirae bacterium]|nr:Spy/CpxP family protein refolding chaperone [Nitrospirota bacterium]
MKKQDEKIRRTTSTGVRGLLIATTIILALAGSLWANSTVGSGVIGSGADGEHILLKAIIQLNLSDAQKSAIAAILKKNSTAVKTDVQGVLTARAALLDAIHSDTYNEAAVRNASKDVASKEEDLAVLRAQIVSEINVVLTPEQKATISETKKEIQDRIAQRVENISALINAWISKNGK